MFKVARTLDRRGVSFRNASIGFHPYDFDNPDDPNPQIAHTFRWIRQTMRRYPVINTEQGYPASVDDGVADPPAPGFGRNLLGRQTMERNNVSWFAWNTSDVQEFTRNYLGTIVPDDQQKRYFWDWEVRTADFLRTLEDARGFFARWLYRFYQYHFDFLTFF